MAPTDLSVLSQWDLARLELIATVEGGKPFCELAYWVEGDGPTVFFFFDKLQERLQFP